MQEGVTALETPSAPIDTCDQVSENISGKMSTPTVSVILTSFNHARYIREAIESVLSQTFTDFELIIWDDCSSDSSWALINEYSDPRIKAFQNEVNKGPVEGVNGVISEMASGKYIAIHHSDDVWEAEKLDKQVGFLDSHPDIGAIFTNALAIGEEGKQLNNTHHYYSNIFDQPNRTRHEWLNRFFYHGNALCHPSVLIRKRCYFDCGMYRPGLAQVTDFDMWIRLCLKYEIHVLPEKLVRFRVRHNEANASGDRAETRIRTSIELYQLFTHFLKLDTFEEFVAVFPKAERFHRDDGFVPGFVLAMLSLEPNAFHVARVFGAVSLFNLIWDDKTHHKIKKLYNFSYNELIELTGKYDVFSVETIATLKKTIAELESQITGPDQNAMHDDNRMANLNRALAERDNQIDNLNQVVFETKVRLIAIENSTLWKMTFPLRRAFEGAPTFRKICRRTAKLVWWGGTLQLGRKLRDWKARDKTTVEQPHFAPPIDDFCLALPLNYPASQWESPPDIAVICHMYYVEMAEEFQRYLRNIPYPFDLFITTDSQEKQLAIENHFSDWNRGKVEIRIAPNRGRDIAPKLISCRDVYDNYEFILHIHTKKSPYEELLSNWRSYLLETLLGSKKNVEGILESFRSDPRLGMVAPQHFEPNRHGIGWGWNFENAKKFARILRVRLSLNGRLDFPSGSMFWARSAALKPLLDCNLSFDEFPNERGQKDGTLGHVIERLYFFVCERAGYRWIKVCQPSLLRQTERIRYVENQKELINFIKDTQYKLLKFRIAQFLKPALIKPKDYAIRTRREIDDLVYEKSPYKAMDFSQFQRELALHIEKKESLIDFDETFYLNANEDIAEIIVNRTFSCGFAHYCLIGKEEGRVWSDYQLRRKFSLSPNFPKGFSAPVHISPLPKSNLDLSHLPPSPRPFLLMLFSHLQENLFFAGYTEFFRDFGPIFEKFSKVVLSVTSENYNPELATRYSQRIEVIQEGELEALKYRPNLVVAFNNQLFIRATQILHELDKIIYYCQDFESGFFPYGDEYVKAEKAIASAHNIIISTDLLRRFLADRQLLSHQRIFTTSPKIKPFDVPPQKTKRLFFYFRPEFFHGRNLPQTLMEAVLNFCQSHKGYEIYMAGTVDTRYSYKINGTPIFILSKLPTADYIQLVSSADVIISMIYSAHPGVIAFQAAASGIPTITNVFENRSASLLKQLSENIVPYDPVRDDLLKLIEIAVSMPKGKKSFNEVLYAGSQTQPLANFIDTVLSDELACTQAICNLS